MKNAKGTRGFILRTLAGYVFRVYDDIGGFTDYDIHHYDLEVTIEEDDAVFYTTDGGVNSLDYRQETGESSDQV